MKIYYSPKFARAYKKLSRRTKDLAEKREKIFRHDPFDPRLKTHKLTGALKNCWSFSIDYQHRIIFEFADDQTIWFHAIGTHDAYR